MTRFRIEVIGEQMNEPPSHYLIEAPDAETALLMASLVDQYTPHRPTNPEAPRQIDRTVELELAKAYASARPIPEEKSKP